MLLANRSVAEFIATGGKMNGVAKKSAKTFVYRIHDEPNQEKVAGLRTFAGNFGYTMEAPEDGRKLAKALNGLLAEAKNKPEFSAIEILALRSMAKACYSTDNIGHYGLGFKFYTHFTSPIRRYPDTMVHRLLQMYLDGADSQSKAYYEDQCKHASEREVIAAEAERSSTKYKLVEFMQDKVGGEFDGHISGLTEWGMYVEIEPTKIEGMVALRDIQSDFFEFDQEHYRIVGKRTGVIYNLGDPVRIRVKSTNLEQKLLDYELVETGREDRMSHHEDIPGQYEERKPAVKVFDRTTRKKDSDRRDGRKSDSFDKGGRKSFGDSSERGERRGFRSKDGDDSPRRDRFSDSRGTRGRGSYPRKENSFRENRPFSEEVREVEPKITVPEAPEVPQPMPETAPAVVKKVRAPKPAAGEGDKAARKAKVKQAIKLSKAKSAKPSSKKSKSAPKADKPASRSKKKSE